MADHYGSAELITGRLLARYPRRAKRPLAFTKWCPEPGPMTADIVRKGVQERLDRLGVEKVDLLQFHWWTFEHPAWLDALHEMARLKEEGLIGAIGVTNFDAAHLRVALADGVPLATNQVSFSLVDRRAAGELSALCREKGVKLLAYGTLCGGFLSDKWLGKPEPTDIADWSRSQIQALHRRRRRLAGLPGHSRARPARSPTSTASRSPTSRRAGCWSTRRSPRRSSARASARASTAPTISKLFGFALDAEDRARLDAAFAATTPIPGDCGDEYRRPPYLTASGDLSHHLDAIPSVYKAEPVPGRPDRLRVSSGSVWEPIAGYSRAVRVKDTIRVSGTTATHGGDRCVAPGDAGAQTTYILDKIAASIAALGGTMEDVVRTRIYLRDAAQWEPVSRAHGRVFGEIMPANTMVEAGDLIGDYEVEIEAEAVVRLD